MREFFEAALPWCSCVIALVAFSVPLFLRDPRRRRDMQIALNPKGAMRVAGWVATAVFALISIGLGLVLLHRYSFAWSFFPLAASMLFVVGYQIQLFRLPFPDLEGDGASEEDDPIDRAG